MNGKSPRTEEQRLAAMKAGVPEVAEILRLLAHQVRLPLLCEIAREECSVSALEQTLGIRQPGLSQQLAELRQHGLVRTRRQARSVYYRIADPRIEKLLAALCDIFCEGGSTAPDDAAPDPAPATRPAQTRHDSARFAQVSR